MRERTEGPLRPLERKVADLQSAKGQISVCSKARRRDKAHLYINLHPRNVERVRRPALLAFPGRGRASVLDSPSMVEVQQDGGEDVLGQEQTDESSVPNPDVDVERD